MTSALIRRSLKLCATSSGGSKRESRSRDRACTVHPLELLECAYGGNKRFAKKLERSDCAVSLLKDEQVDLPKHVCYETARASTSTYARRHFLPNEAEKDSIEAQTEAQKMWVNEWPLPLGEQAMREFAGDRGLRVEDLPRPSPPDEWPELVGLWIERRFGDTPVRLLGSVDFDSETDYYRFGRAQLHTHHVSTISDNISTPVENGDRGAELNRQDLRASRDREIANLDGAHRWTKRLLTYYESYVLGVGFRGRSKDKQLLAARAAFPEMLKRATDHAREDNRSQRRKSDPRWVLQNSDGDWGGLDMGDATPYRWIEDDKLSWDPSDNDGQDSP